MDIEGYKQVTEALGEHVTVVPELTAAKKNENNENTDAAEDGGSIVAAEDDESLNFPQEVEFISIESGVVQPAYILERLGRAGLLAADNHTRDEFSPTSSPALRFVGQSAAYEHGDVRHFLTFRDLNANL